jgi:hypothetical protein
MHTGQRTRVSVELDDHEPIAGRVIDGTHEIPFVGWLQLTAALERARHSGDQGRRHPNAAEVEEKS